MCKAPSNAFTLCHPKPHKERPHVMTPSVNHSKVSLVSQMHNPETNWLTEGMANRETDFRQNDGTIEPNKRQFVGQPVSVTT